MASITRSWKSVSENLVKASHNWEVNAPCSVLCPLQIGWAFTGFYRVLPLPAEFENHDDTDDTDDMDESWTEILVES